MIRAPLPRLGPTAILLSLMIPFSPVTAQEPAVQALQRVATVAEPFSRIRGLVELPDGRLLVADQIEKALYVTDVHGGPRHQIGHNGAGPHEYRYGVGLFPAHGDTALLYDIANARFDLVTADSVVGTLPFSSYHLADGFPRFVTPDRAVYLDRVTRLRLAKRSDPGADEAPVLRYLPGGDVRTLAQLTVPGPVNPGPLPEWDRWAVAPDGRVVIVRNQNEYRVDWVSPGKLVRGPVVQETRTPLSGADRAALRDSSRTGNTRMGGVAPQGARPLRPDIHLPGRFPFARSVQVDRQGRAWVWRFQSVRASTNLFDVFDEHGRRIARYTVPAGSTLLGFGDHALYAARVDADGLQWVEEYRIPD